MHCACLDLWCTQHTGLQHVSARCAGSGVKLTSTLAVACTWPWSSRTLSCISRACMPLRPYLRRSLEASLDASCSLMPLLPAAQAGRACCDGSDACCECKACERTVQRLSVCPIWHSLWPRDHAIQLLTSKTLCIACGRTWQVVQVGWKEATFP